MCFATVSSETREDVIRSYSALSSAPSREASVSRRKAGVLHRIRADKHRIGGTVVRQHDAVAVCDPSARRDHGDLAGPLVKRKIAQVLPVHHLQIKETRENEQKKKGYCQNNGK